MLIIMLSVLSLLAVVIITRFFTGIKTGRDERHIEYFTPDEDVYRGIFTDRG